MGVSAGWELFLLKWWITRQGYDKYGGKNLYPFDGAFNFPKDTYRLGLRRRVVEGAMLNSFDEVTASIERMTGSPRHWRKRQN
ncbi:MAG: hypothetical protein K8F91_15530 [Candidatus Obscuribacterales bacterium]|nr:hypothetical protein [Candidatus Obscuribacterales bacterium]